MYSLYDKSSTFLSTYFDNNLRSDMPFKARLIFSLMGFEKLSFESRYTPKCFVNGSLDTVILLKMRLGCMDFCFCMRTLFQ